jgi:hypothetical protein
MDERAAFLGGMPILLLLEQLSYGIKSSLKFLNRRTLAKASSFGPSTLETLCSLFALCSVPHTILTVTYCKKKKSLSQPRRIFKDEENGFKMELKHHLLIKVETA